MPFQILDSEPGHFLALYSLIPGKPGSPADRLHATESWRDSRGGRVYFQRRIMDQVMCRSSTQKLQRISGT